MKLTPMAPSPAGEFLAGISRAMGEKSSNVPIIPGTEKNMYSSYPQGFSKHARNFPIGTKSEIIKFHRDMDLKQEHKRS
jgi:hypothetical protein